MNKECRERQDTFYEDVSETACSSDNQIFCRVVVAKNIV